MPIKQYYFKPTRVFADRVFYVPWASINRWVINPDTQVLSIHLELKEPLWTCFEGNGCSFWRVKLPQKTQRINRFQAIPGIYVYLVLGVMCLLPNLPLFHHSNSNFLPLASLSSPPSLRGVCYISIFASPWSPAIAYWTLAPWLLIWENSNVHVKSSCKSWFIVVLLSPYAPRVWHGHHGHWKMMVGCIMKIMGFCYSTLEV